MKNIVSIIFILIVASLSLSAQTNDAIFKSIDNKDARGLTLSINWNNVNSYNVNGETPLTYLLQTKKYYPALEKYL